MTMRIVVNIDVPELEPAIAFYCAALRLEHNRTLDDDVAELTGTSSVIYLLKNPPGSSSAGNHSDKRRYSRHWTRVHIDFVVEDIEEAAKQVLDAGATQEGECIEWMNSKFMTFSDPFGMAFVL